MRRRAQAFTDLGRAERAQCAEAEVRCRGRRAVGAAYGLHQAAPVAGRAEVVWLGTVRATGWTVVNQRDGAGQVDVVEQVLAAVSFQVEADPVAAGPAGEGQGECGQQDVVDAGAVRGGRGAQQGRGVVLAELDGEGAGLACVGLRPVGGGRRLGCHRFLPVGQFVVEAAPRDVGGEAPRPVPEGGGAFLPA
ncbi:hypothetical protein SMD44_08960 [Streptomyces alboflavus]|uniref:Uncharacterized protein n=1 Tax=Streptomyces alboflavus TaxID=67267 RepID=A0A1Z1WSQ6_9ACTN|nr:hypothetical protein SMD44_08960 [Streptomyces alboflavus]